MPFQVSFLTAVSFVVLALIVGCGDGDTSEDGGSPAAADGESVASDNDSSSQRENSETDGETADADGTDKIDLAEFLPERSTSTPEAASLADLKFEIVPYTEKDGDQVRTKGTRKEYTNGEVQRHGKHTHYYDNGKPQSSGDYDNDLKQGPWTFWHPDGIKAKQGEYDNGLATGMWTTWFASGKPQSEGAYERSKPVGAWKFYDADGKMTTRDFSAKPDAPQ